MWIWTSVFRLAQPTSTLITAEQQQRSTPRLNHCHSFGFGRLNCMFGLLCILSIHSRSRVSSAIVLSWEICCDRIVCVCVCACVRFPMIMLMELRNRIATRTPRYNWLSMKMFSGFSRMWLADGLTTHYKAHFYNSESNWFHSVCILFLVSVEL